MIKKNWNPSVKLEKIGSLKKTIILDGLAFLCCFKKVCIDALYYCHEAKHFDLSVLQLDLLLTKDFREDLFFSINRIIQAPPAPEMRKNCCYIKPNSYFFNQSTSLEKYNTPKRYKEIHACEQF